MCHDCNGNGLCEHGRVKTQCKECGGSQIGEHAGGQADCRDCHGTEICPHHYHKCKCRKCEANLCSHGKFKHICPDFDGKEICKSKQEPITQVVGAMEIGS